MKIFYIVLIILAFCGIGYELQKINKTLMFYAATLNTHGDCIITNQECIKTLQKIAIITKDSK